MVVESDKPAITPEQEAKKKAEQAEANKDVMFMMLAVFCTLAFVSACMVSTDFCLAIRIEY